MSKQLLPAWAREIIALYEGDAASQFIVYGNVNDRMLLPASGGLALGGIHEFFLRVLMPRFDVILSYDLGNGIRVEKGQEIFSEWPAVRETGAELPKSPRAAIETITRYFRYSANLARLGKPARHIGCVVKAAHLVAPALPGALNYDLNALALLMRDWACDDALIGQPLVTCLLTDNLNDLHPLLVNNPRAAAIKVPLPPVEELAEALGALGPKFPKALADVAEKPGDAARQLAGVTLAATETLLRRKEHEGVALSSEDLSAMKKELVERDCEGLIEFIEPKRTLEDLFGQEKIKAWLRQDIALWRQSDLQALPMGYLLCGPVGTGKTFMVECLAGEARVPIVKLKNFRDKWVGSTEGNLEKIFRLLQALGRCYVFVDEADQALGKRESGGNDAGLSGRVYSMFAKEMSNTDNRGRIVWVLASSRPDLIEVDLKRPGRVDVKIPIFPTTTAEEGFSLIRALCKRREVALDQAAFEATRELIPDLLTPGAAEAIAVRVYRRMRTAETTPIEALQFALKDYQPAVSPEVMAFQIRLAAEEATDREFVPERLRE
jgi:hypothetical protein